MEDSFSKQTVHGQIRLVIDSAGFLDTLPFVATPAFQMPSPGTSLLVTVAAAKVGRKDTYVEVRLKDTTAVGKTFVSRDHNPTWDNQFKFKPDRFDRAVVLFKLYRDDILGAVLLGCVEIPVATLFGRGHINQWFELFEDQFCKKKCGYSIQVLMTLGENHPVAAPMVQVVAVPVPVPVMQPMAYPPQQQYTTQPQQSQVPVYGAQPQAYPQSQPQQPYSPQSQPQPYSPQSQPQQPYSPQSQPQPQQAYGGQAPTATITVTVPAPAYMNPSNSQPTPSAPYTGSYEGLYPSIPSTNPQVQVQVQQPQYNNVRQ